MMACGMSWQRAFLECNLHCCGMHAWHLPRHYLLARVAWCAIGECAFPDLPLHHARLNTFATAFCHALSDGNDCGVFVALVNQVVFVEAALWMQAPSGVQEVLVETDRLVGAFPYFLCGEYIRAALPSVV